MKVLILGFSKIAYMPYVNFYLEALRDVKAEIHVVCWLRDNEPDSKLDYKRVIIHVFKKNQADEVAKVSKLGSFFRYRRYVMDLLRYEQFDRIITLHTFPAVLMVDVLLRQYRDKFIMDYRDYTYEKVWLFRRVIHNLVKASYATFVSSDAFREMLPQMDKVYTSHNLLVESLKYRNVHPSSNGVVEPIRVSFWGFIRHEKINAEIIRKLGNDRRFELHYYGREQRTALILKNFVDKEGFKNVFFHGTYKPQDRYTFAAQTDMIHNMYENDEGTKLAMGNKYYDGIIFRIPQICTKGSYMGDRVELRKVGIAVDPYNPDFPELLYVFFQSYNRNEFTANCDAELETVIDQYEKGNIIIRHFLDE